MSSRPRACVCARHPICRRALRENDVELAARQPLLLVTGSNMSGKSTLLRASAAMSSSPGRRSSARQPCHCHHSPHSRADESRTPSRRASHSSSPSCSGCALSWMPRVPPLTARSSICSTRCSTGPTPPNAASPRARSSSICSSNGPSASSLRTTCHSPMNRPSTGRRPRYFTSASRAMNTRAHGLRLHPCAPASPPPPMRSHCWRRRTHALTSTGLDATRVPAGFSTAGPG